MTSSFERWLNGTLIESTVDHGDGTGTKTVYTTDPPTVTPLTGLPIPTPPEPTAEERLASLVAALADAQSLEEIRTAAAGIV
jgi:hypothetical protein